MAKSRKNFKKIKRSSSKIMKSVKNTTYKAIPVVKTGLKKVGSTVKTVAVKSAPTINKGLNELYGTLATGVDMGVKGVKIGMKKMSKKKKH
jgi:activator of HSP90 ATPase